MKDKPEIYFSCDIEADGPITPDYSMLSLGCAAFQPWGDMIDTFQANLQTLPNAKEDPDTMNFWAKNKEAYEETRKNQIDPRIAMHQFSSWIKDVCQKNDNAKPVFVGYPATYDFNFTYYYLMHFTGFSPFSFSGLDIKSYGMALMGTNFKDTVKKNFPKEWRSKQRHTHIAVDDAIEQGEMFMKMLKENINDKHKTLLYFDLER